MLYKDNPNLGRKTVTTAGGEKEYLFNCRKIKGEYFIQNVDCFYIESNKLWYRLKSGLIEFDCEKKKWILKKEAEKTCVRGVVGFKEDGSLIIGWYTPNLYNNCEVQHPILGRFNAINSDILLENGWAEDFSTGVWHIKKDVSRLQKPRNEIDHTKKGYNLEDNTVEMLNKISLYESRSPIFSKDVRRYGKMLDNLTFGLEIECEKGYLPEHIQNRLGVVICRDGSLHTNNDKIGPEFVTIPLKGAKGLQTIVDLSKELSKRTSIGLNCSLHIHFGNIPTTRMFLISLFRLGNKVQNELFTMFPFYKTNPEVKGGKNYCQKLPTLSIYAAEESMNQEEFSEYINSNYKKLFSWLGEGCQPDKQYNRKEKKHPAGTMKWSWHKRYYWLNFMNTIFSNRNTLEFRLHTPTTNAQKMINWLFICAAIVRYANTHSREILLSRNGITLNQIMDVYKQYGTRGEFLSRYLMAYINERKEKFSKDFENKEYVSMWEIAEDKNYMFTFESVSHLF